MQRLAVFATIALGLAGCAIPAPEPVDDMPQHPTAVLSAEFAVTGYVLPDSHGRQQVYTRADRRRIDQRHEYDSMMSRMMLGSYAVGDIARLDRNLTWTLSEKDKTYVECPLRGCTGQQLAGMKPRDEGEEAHDYKPSTEGCSTTLARNTLTVKPTGQGRVVNGFDTRQYVAEWYVEFQDKKKRADKNRLRFELWTTEPTAAMREAWAMHEAFQRGHLQRTGADANPLARFVSQEIYMALAAFSGDTARDKTWNTRAAREFAKVKGYPISIKMEWFLDAQACRDPKPEKTEKPGFDVTDPLGSLGKMAGDSAAKAVEQRFTPKPDEPMLRYVYEVKELAVKPVRDGVFEVPAGYKLMNRK
jgi:hypothetical protein